MCQCYCGVHDKLSVIGQFFLLALACVAVRCKCIFMHETATVLHMMVLQ
jgi:hypothetical protein